MPFAQVHYPFENAEWFEDHFPADFIVEYVGQTRGWFYTLHVLATALFDRPPFSTCVAHGIVLGDDGRKMSKRLRNYPDPEEVFATHGRRRHALVPALLAGAARPGRRRSRTRRSPSRSAQVLNPIWNALVLPCRSTPTPTASAGRVRTDQRGRARPLHPGQDRARSSTTSPRPWTPTTSPARVRAVTGFLDALTNWYVRRSRDRFWRPAAGGRRQRRRPTSRTPTTPCTPCSTCSAGSRRRSCPSSPRQVYRGLTGERSVHLADWPAPDELPADPELVAAMDLVRERLLGRPLDPQGHRAAGPACRCAAHRGRRRRPTGSRPFVDLIADEVNVKQVVLTDDVGDLGRDRCSPSCRPRSAPGSARDTQQVIAAAAKPGQWARADDGGVEVGGVAPRAGRVRAGAPPRRTPSPRGPCRARSASCLDLGRRRARGRGGGARRGPPRPAGAGGTPACT